MTDKQISIMIKPASASCNLRCRYCFYADISENRMTASNGIMKDETLAVLCARINEALDGKGTANISFQGGEPTLAGLGYFRRFIAEMKRYEGIIPVYALQTNGTMIDEEWADFFLENHFLIGISLDGYQSNMDYFRFDAEKKSVFYRILKTVDILEKKHVEYNILTVVTKKLAARPQALMKFYREHHFQYVQLIPCLPALKAEDDPYALTPREYASFYNGFFDEWLKQTEKGYPMSVNLFDNLYEMLQGRMPYQCGMLGRCTIQFVVESNGDTYPCDFWCLDEYRMGNLHDSSFTELAKSEAARRFMQTDICMKKPCENCRYQKMCGGGCRRQNVCYLNDETCAYQQVLDHILPILSRMGR